MPDNADEMRDILKQVARDVIYFPRVFPPIHPMKSLSFFGGEPVGPAGFVWPRDPEHHEPQLFMGQLNLEDLPQIDVTKKLPRDGVMYFFARNAYEGQVGTFLYHRGPTDAWETIPQPDDIPPTYTDNYRWNDQYAGRTPSFPKWEVRPTKALDYPRRDEFLLNAVLEGDDAAFELFEQEQQLLQQEATKEVVLGLRRALPEQSQEKLKPGASKKDQTLPKVWLSIEMFCKTRDGEVPSADHIPADVPLDDLSSEELLAYFYMRARQHDAMDEVPDREWNDFERLLPKIGISSTRWSLVAAMTIEHCLSYSSKTAAMISSEQINYVAHRHGSLHQCGGFPPATNGHHIENDYGNYLLMHFDGLDRGQHWVFDAIIQFWIKKSDFQNEGLSSVFATLDS